MKKYLSIGILIFCVYTSIAQFAPAAGKNGTTALHKDSSAFVNWAKTCTVERGLQDITQPELGLANVGTAENALGIAKGNTIVSLGDGGTAVLTFDPPITNGDGYDFAIFENGFSDSFLELAFVEVSSDGERYVRFPAISATQTETQIGGFDYLEAEAIHNFAGKYRVFFGTPFDLAELKDSIGINVNAITHVKIIDVVGIINSQHTRYDSEGNMVNDPWPTPFGSGGFDLDAVGVIHQASTNSTQNLTQLQINAFPNPFSEVLNISAAEEIAALSIYSLSGKLLYTSNEASYFYTLNLSDLPKGMYVVNIQIKKNNYHYKVVKQ